MSFIVTADLQAEWSNLDLCTKSWAEVIKLCKKYHLKYIVFAGDGKEVYDPVSIRVIKWWQRAIRIARKRGLTVIYLRGNHDRIATFDVAGSWLSILKNAGAVTFDKPGVYDAGDQRFFMLPYAKVKTIKRWMKKLIKHKPDKHKDILFFHANLLEARYSQHGIQSNSHLSIADLSSDKFKYCIGGDVHLPQEINENSFYVGSAFCHDWGEVNQVKRYIIVGKDIRSVQSRINGWYDPSVNGFQVSKPTIWNGAKLRISVECDAGSDYGRRIEKVRRRAEKKYPGAELYIIPKFNNERFETHGISSDSTDEEKLRKYVSEQAVPNSLKESKVIEYMMGVLSHFAGGLRGKTRIKFLEASFEYALSFKRLHVDLTKRGITVIKGVNLDRQGKSNGSGKTGFMQSIPVALFGRTFKKQAHDHWSNRWYPKKKALAQVIVQDDRDNKVEVIRGRRPTMLKLLVNGRNESTGMKSTDRLATQAQLESKLGFTWDTLANAVYIDPAIAHAFLSGTNKQRTDVLSRFQNLERFEHALKYVKKDSKKNDNKIIDIDHKIEFVDGQMEELHKYLKELKALRDTQISSASKKYQKAKSRYGKFNRKSYKRLKHRYHKLAILYEKASEHVRKYDSKESVAANKYSSATHLSRKWLRLKHTDKCPTCFQDVNKKVIGKNIHHVTKRLHELKERHARAVVRLEYARKTYSIAGETFDNTRDELSHLKAKENDLRLSMEQAFDSYREIKQEKHAAQQLISKTKNKLKQLKHKKSSYDRYKDKLYKRRMMYDYTTQAFSRDGIPAFLNRQLCPHLNHASDYYAELFSDKEIQVRFKVEKGEFVPYIVNAKGGEDIDDQSRGERALAGLIASFALREAAPKTNILMLDEPAEGLDEQTSKQFAKGLIELKKKFKTIFICTHNRAIESALSAEHQITITKKGGVSRVT